MYRYDPQHQWDRSGLLLRSLDGVHICTLFCDGDREDLAELRSAARVLLSESQV